MRPEALKESIKVLIVEDDDEDFEIARDLLREVDSAHYEVEQSKTFADARERIALGVHDVYLIDYRLGPDNGLDLVREALQRGVEQPFIVLTGARDRQVDLAAMDAGASDFLVKGVLTAVTLERSVRYARERARVAEITRQRDALRESEARMRQLADALPQIVWTAGATGELDYANERWTEYLGRRLEGGPAEAVWRAIVNPQDLERTVASWTASIRDGTTFETECRLLRARDRLWRWHLGRALPVRGETSGVTKWFGTWTDIQDQRDAIQAREDFLASAAHELKNPLNALQLGVDSMEGLISDVSSRSKERIARTQRSARRLAELVDRLLDVARLRAGKLTLDFSEVDLASVTRDVIDRESDTIRQSGCTVAFEGDPSVVGWWDLLRIDQIVTNLVTNAVKFGQGKPIRVSVHGHGDQATLSVQDQGVGISREEQARLFAPFTRAAPLKSVGGFGLGLWIVAQLVDALGGHVELESELGKGATFKVTLPRRPSLAGRASAA
jgi:signal transduction histidine kinase